MDGSMKEYNCQKCGSCCKFVGQLVNDARRIKEEGAIENQRQADLIENICAFPYSWDIHGKCEKLVDNLCTVYLNRPFICNVKRVYKRIFNDIPWKVYTKSNRENCEKYRKLAKEKY